MDSNATPGNVNGEIDRRSNLSYEEFSGRYMYANKPVIFTDALGPWRALSRWTPNFFQSEFGDMTFSIAEGRKSSSYSEKTNGMVQYTMAHFIDRVLESSDDSPAPYFRNQSLSGMFPSLKADVEPAPEYFFPNWLLDQYTIKRFHAALHHYGILELFIGGRGGTFPVLHYDHGGLHAFLMQIYGRKRYVLYPPDQTPYMYPTKEKPNLSMVNSVFEPDLNRFPLFAKAVPTTFELAAGEMMFLPSGWWHTVKMLTPSITLSLNMINHSNWQALVNTKRSNPLVSLASRVYLTGAGAWRAWRDRDWSTRGRARVQPSATWYV